MKDLDGKTILITGATNGIGRAAAAELAKTGAAIVIHGRDRARAEKTAKEISALTSNPRVGFITADFASLAEVKKMAGEFQSRYGRLDVLLNNAGGVFTDGGVSKDGYEITFAVNCLSHFLLTGLLTDLIEKSVPARIVHVSSMAHLGLSRLDPDALGVPGKLKGFAAYSASKLCNILYSNVMAERFAGRGVTSNALHPGMVRSGFGQNTRSGFLKGLVNFFYLAGITPEKGAGNSVYLASSPEAEGITGKYFVRNRPARTSKLAADAELAGRVWEACERMTGKFR